VDSTLILLNQEANVAASLCLTQVQQLLLHVTNAAAFASRFSSLFSFSISR